MQLNSSKMRWEALDDAVAGAAIARMCFSVLPDMSRIAARQQRRLSVDAAAPAVHIPFRYTLKKSRIRRRCSCKMCMSDSREASLGWKSLKIQRFLGP